MTVQWRESECSTPAIPARVINAMSVPSHSVKIAARTLARVETSPTLTPTRGQENEDRYQTQEHHYGASDEFCLSVRTRPKHEEGCDEQE